MKNIYKLQPEFVYRIPHFTKNKTNDLELLIGDPVFQEALFYASPILYNAIASVNFNLDKLDSKKKISLTKYGNRISSRCSPFGLFSATGVGQFDEHTSNNTNFNFNSTLNLSINIVKAFDLLLINDTLDHPDVLYFPNTTLFFIPKRIRLTKKNSLKGKENHEVVEISKSSYLTDLLNFAKSGKKKVDLINYLIKKDYVDNAKESAEFINMIINEGIFVHQFDTKLVLESYDYFENKLSNSKLKFVKNSSANILAIERSLKEINNLPIGKRIQELFQVKNEIEQLLPNDISNPFLVNLYTENNVKLDKNIAGLIENALEALNILTSEAPDYQLVNFKNQFFQKFEFQEVPLLQILDPDWGIGFGNSSTSRKKNILSSMLKTLQQQDKIIPQKTVVDSVLIKAYQDSIANNRQFINLTRKDFEDRKPDWSGCPKNILALIEVYSSTIQDSFLYLQLAGGASSTNVLGRFYGDSPKIQKIVDRIILEEEEGLENDTIFAEIDYVPENDALCNIIRRKKFREKRIPISAVPDGNSKNQILLTDLYLSMNAERKIMLRSKKLNKWIIPRNTTAHNFNNDENPLYRFLSMLYTQDNKKSMLKLSWGNLEPINNFFPRVLFESKIILSLAKWKIYSKQIRHKENFVDELKEIIQAMKIPRFAKIGDDSGLTIDLNNASSYEIIKLELSKNEFIFLQEMLFDKQSALLSDQDDYYHNEILLSLNRTIDENEKTIFS